MRKIDASQLPYVPRGKRALITGRTGSGKTQLARWLLARSPGAWVVLNPKHTRGYDKIAGSSFIYSLDLEALNAAFEKSRIVIVNPGPHENHPEILDTFIEQLRLTYSNLGLVIDELLLLHGGRNLGDGVKHWLTMGRESNMSFIGITQRPKRVDMFLFSESDFFGIMQLNLLDDRKRVFEFVGDERVLVNPPLHHWRWYVVDDDVLTSFGPVPI